MTGKMPDGPADSSEGAGFHKIVSTYAARFGPDDDQTTVTDEQRTKRQYTAAHGTDQYYDFATEAYLSGWGEHFHYCPFAPHEPILQAMAFYEHRFAMLMGLKPGMKVLDVGCGVGGPAREIAKFIGCEIVGITINHRQVRRARELTRDAGLEDKCVFVQGDFLNLPFPPSSFDAAYAIEATVHAPSLTDVYAGIRRVLKPGGTFGLSEWVLNKTYNSLDPNHVGIRNRIERGNAISNLQTDTQCRQALLRAGFTVGYDKDYATHWSRLGASGRRPSIPGESPQDPSSRSVQDPSSTSVQDPSSTSVQDIALHPSTTTNHHPINTSTTSISTNTTTTKIYLNRPWYYPLAGDHRLSSTWTDWWIAVRMSPRVRKHFTRFIRVMEALHIWRQGTLSAMTTMAYCVDSVVEGGREGIFTPCWWFICRNAEDEEMMAGAGEDYPGVRVDG